MAYAKELAEKVSMMAIVKLGKIGSFVKYNEMLWRSLIPAVPVGNICNTNGAGDAYATGFLYGLSQGYHKNYPHGVNLCGRLGSLVASYVIQEQGPRIGMDKKRKLKKDVKNLISSYG